MIEQNTQLATLPEPATLNPIQLLQIAVQKGVDAEQLKMLMELQREWKADQARDAFVNAMNAFRSEALKVVKTKEVSFGTTAYKHATLANTVAIVAPALSKHGFSHRWETSQDGQIITVACVITHQLGHSERTTLSAPPDQTGGKNAIQAVGSAVSYLQRYTFMAITGLAASDQDDDGQKTGATLEPKRMKSIVGGLQKAVTDKDSAAAKTIWAELTNPERELVWTELRSVSALRAAIKRLLGASKTPPQGDDLAPWAVETIKGSRSLDELGTVWRLIQDAYHERDQETPPDVEILYTDRKGELNG